MSRVLTLHMSSTFDDDYNMEQRIDEVTESGTKVHFYAYDLSDYPEDATLNRDLFSGWEYVNALRLGMKLAQEGYTDIELTNKEERK